jgi:hypothetical protein
MVLFNAHLKPIMVQECSNRQRIILQWGDHYLITFVRGVAWGVVIIVLSFLGRCGALRNNYNILAWGVSGGQYGRLHFHLM